MDREANSRGTSVYLPDRAIPMLPPELSTNLASLVPNRDRLCMAVEMHIDDKGHVSSHRIFEAVMRSHGSSTMKAWLGRLGSLNMDLTSRPPKSESRH